MNLTEAMAAVLQELGTATSSRDIADRIWDRFDQFRNTEAQLSSTRYSEPIEALRAAVATTAKQSRRFIQDRSGGVILVSLSGTPAPWTDDELEASVVSYLEMRALALGGAPFVKKSYYSALAKRFGRSSSAYEFRMQNISAILSSQGRYWVPGLPPARNVGSNITATITGIFFRLEGRAHEALMPPNGSALMAIPEGEREPVARSAVVMRFERDQEVRDWVLQAAKGVCEACDSPAPFISIAGPFLEVHHLRRLADGGSDTISNALALCPNCHRRLHYSLEAPHVIDEIYRKVPRLAREPMKDHGM